MNYIEEKFNKLNISSNNSNNSNNSKDRVNVVSVDVGVQHLGITEVSIPITGNNAWREMRVKDVNLVNLMEITHTNVKYKDCKLHHSNEFVDRMEHLFQEYTMFDSADIILVERQPVISSFGLTIQNIILMRYRAKTELVSPNAMHAHFSINSFSYDARKHYVTMKFKNALREANNESIIRKLAIMEMWNVRIHDVSDAFCLADYWRTQKQKSHQYKTRFGITMDGLNKSLDDFYEEYRFKGNDEPKRD